MTSGNPFTHPMTVDRAALSRDGDHEEAAYAVVVREGDVLADARGLMLLAPGEWSAHALIAYLGNDGERDYVAVRVHEATDHEERGARFVAVRTLIRTLGTGRADARDRELALTATALARWHESHSWCPRCGAQTSTSPGGWQRRCEQCERDLYPRTDPAVIVAITDADDRLLLAHASYWSARRYSHLAGYVEPGESFEQAVHREVMEEAGLSLTDLEYLGSQPWPFPASVMVGFRAHAASTDLHLDFDEISDAMWVTRDDLAGRVSDRSVILAPRGSIARVMIEAWHGDPAELTRLEDG